ncbi:MAG: replication initiation protein [Rhodopila sp.]
MRDEDPDAKLVYRHECSQAFAAERWQEKATRKAAHRERLRHGFFWPGGAVGGNERYQREPFWYPGLVSDRHPMLLFFASKVPKGKTLVCGDGKAVVSRAPHRSKLLGCDMAYVVGNQSVRGFLRVEMDRRLSVADVKEACRAAGIPLPNIAVGHADASGALLNPHLLWLLEHSVTFTDRGRRRFTSLFKAVLRGLTAALMPYGADPGGYSNAMRVKSPLSPPWQSDVLAEVPYSLATLKGCVDLSAKLPGAAGTDPVPQDHPDAAIAAGSNMLFNRLRAWAYEQVVMVRDAQGRDQESFEEMVAAKAEELAPWLRLGGSIRSSDEGARRRDPLARLVTQVAAAPGDAGGGVDLEELSGEGEPSVCSGGGGAAG